MHPSLIESRHHRATKSGRGPGRALREGEEGDGKSARKMQKNGTGRAKINNSQDAAGRKQMAPGLRGLSGPWQKPVTHIT